MQCKMDQPGSVLFPRFVRFCPELVGINKRMTAAMTSNLGSRKPQKIDYTGSLDEVFGYRCHGRAAYPLMTKELIEGAQTLNVVLAGPAECEGRWGTALGASGGLSPRHAIAFRLDCDLAPGATLRSGRHSPSTGSKAAGWPPGPGHDATRPAGSAGSPMSKREWHRVHPKLDCSCF